MKQLQINKIGVFWFRRDLRVEDNAGLFYALNSGLPILPVFVFDTHILDRLENKTDPRITFIYNALEAINHKLKPYQSSLRVFHGKPNEVFERLTNEFDIHAVWANEDYEPYARERDLEMEKYFKSKGVSFFLSKDQVIFSKDEVLSDTGTPYRVFTPYKKKWLTKLNDRCLVSYPSENHLGQLVTQDFTLPALSVLGFSRSTLVLPSATVMQQVITRYDKQRDYPALDGTSKLGIHFRFGTLSVREKVRKAIKLSEVWLSELIWREFFMQLLWHFPYVIERPFNLKFERVAYRYNDEEWIRWKDGYTGYPLVDAGMRELNSTGHMHNRVRMVVASFLTKHLLMDWRLGEAYFASKLLDYELASNNGNWQWSAGTGADAQPYFRIFNPVAQQQKFDPDFLYIRKWVPEWNTASYPVPMVDHRMATARAQEAFRVLKA